MAALTRRGNENLLVGRTLAVSDRMERALATRVSAAASMVAIDPLLGTCSGIFCCGIVAFAGSAPGELRTCFALIRCVASKGDRRRGAWIEEVELRVTVTDAPE